MFSICFYTFGSIFDIVNKSKGSADVDPGSGEDFRRHPH